MLVTEIEEHITKHGEGVKVIALLMMPKKLGRTQKRCKILYEPTKIEDENGVVIRSGIHTYVIRLWLVERKNYNGIFLPL